MINKFKALLLKLDAYGHGPDCHGLATSSTNAPQTTSLAKLTTLCAILAIIAYLALFNPFGVTPDYPPYIASFDWARQASWSQVFPNPNSWEPGFMLLVFMLAKAIAANSWVFLFTVAFASSIKLGLLYKIASPIAFFLAMVLFFFKYFPLQDYNQLRGAIAISFLMLVYYQWIWQDNLKLAILFSVCAVCFHYLALAVLPFIFFVKHRKFLKRSGPLLVFAVLIALSLGAGYVLLQYLAPLIPRLSIQSYLAPATSSLLSPVFYPEVLLLAVSLLFWNDCTSNMKRVVAIQMMGFAIFYGFFDFEVIAIRLREAFSIFWLFYLVDYSRTTPRLRLAVVAFVLMNIALGSYLFYFSNYLK